MPKRRTRGISSKIISPFAVALSALVVAKVHDQATETFIVACIGVGAAFFAPADDVTYVDELDVDEPAIDTRVVPDPPPDA